jgi:hypothetical protein
LAAGPDPHDGDPVAPRPLRIASDAPAPAALPAGVSELEQWHTELTVPQDTIEGNSLVAKYSGIPANQPQSYANAVYVWEGTVVPWTAPPIGGVKIDSDATRGAALVENLSIGTDDYTVAYAVGDAVGDIAATITFDGKGNTVRSRGVELQLTRVEDGIVSLHYRTPPGYRPGKWGNWVGLYRGEASPYDPPEAIGDVEVPDVNEEQLAITKAPLTSGNAYTLAYFMRPAPSTAVAALLTFRLAGHRA